MVFAGSSTALGLHSEHGHPPESLLQSLELVLSTTSKSNWMELTNLGLLTAPLPYPPWLMVIVTESLSGNEETPTI